MTEGLSAVHDVFHVS
jgi:hypothetical protein